MSLVTTATSWCHCDRSNQIEQALSAWSNLQAQRPQIWGMTIPMIAVQTRRKNDPTATTNHCTKPNGGMFSQTSFRSTSIPP